LPYREEAFCVLECYRPLIYVNETITFYKTQLIVNGDEKTYIITPQNNSFNIPSVGIPSGYTLTG
jgi:hypothetical protein